MTTPLPPVTEDPDVMKGLEIQDQYLKVVQKVRGDVTITDLTKAEALLNLWTSALDMLAQARDSYESRRQARMAKLAAVIPVGPLIPTGASPADAAFLQNAFRDALDEARAGDRSKRVAMLTDATRFGDDVRSRAVLTAAADDGQSDVIDIWANNHPELKAQLDELMALRGDLMSAMTARKAFGQVFPIQKPDECNYLDGLRAEAKRQLAVTTRAWNHNIHGVTNPALPGYFGNFANPGQ